MEPKTVYLTPNPPPARLRYARRAFARLKKCTTCWGRGFIRLVPQRRDASGVRQPIRRATVIERCGCLAR